MAYLYKGTISFEIAVPENAKLTFEEIVDYLEEQLKSYLDDKGWPGLGYAQIKCIDADVEIAGPL